MEILHHCLYVFNRANLDILFEESYLFVRDCFLLPTDNLNVTFKMRASVIIRQLLGLGKDFNSD